MTTTTVSIPAPGGTVTIVDNTAVAVQALTVLLDRTWGAQGLNVPGTAITNLARINTNTAGQVTMLVEIINSLDSIKDNLELLNNNMTRLNANAALGVTVQQMQFLDQAKSNQFNQANANAALIRAKEKPIEIPKGDLATNVKTTINDISDLNVMAQVATITSNGLNFVTTTAFQIGDDLIGGALDATGITALWKDAQKKLKTLYNAIPFSRRAAADTNATASVTQSGTPAVTPPTTTIDT